MKMTVELHMIMSIITKKPGRMNRLFLCYQ